jgi:hypothetical protein
MQHETSELTIVNAALPPLPDIADPEVQVWREVDGTVCAYGYTVGEQHWMYLPGLANFCFGEDVNGVTAIPHDHVRQELVLDAFHRNVLPIVLQTRGREVLHASAVLTPRGVVALCARSGTGKSTMAFALSQQGWPLWADDAVAFEVLRERVTAFQLPFSVRLLPEAAAYFERGSAAEDNARHPAATDHGGTSEPLVALLVLNRMPDVDNNGGATVRIRRVPSNRAFLDLLAHAYDFGLQEVERKRGMMQQYLDLVNRIPVFEVSFRPGLKMLPTVVEGIRQLVLNIERNAANGCDGTQ